MRRKKRERRFWAIDEDGRLTGEIWGLSGCILTRLERVRSYVFRFWDGTYYQFIMPIRFAKTWDHCGDGIGRKVL